VGQLRTQRLDSASQSSSRVPPGTSSTSREKGAGRTLRHDRSTAELVTGTSSRGGSSLLRRNVMIEPSEYGRRVADSTDSRENAYSDARYAGLLYLGDNTTICPEAGNKGWLEGHKKTKPIFWTNAHPAELEDTMRKAHQACIPPRYTESDV